MQPQVIRDSERSVVDFFMASPNNRSVDGFRGSHYIRLRKIRAVQRVAGTGETVAARQGTHGRQSSFLGHSGGFMRITRGILGLTIALMAAPVGIGYAHGAGSMGGSASTGSAG